LRFDVLSLLLREKYLNGLLKAREKKKGVKGKTQSAPLFPAVARENTGEVQKQLKNLPGGVPSGHVI
jgi:hypothetical protein